MDDNLQEQAAAYALGALAETERQQFERALADDHELRQLVRDFMDTLGLVAQSLPQVAPPAHLRERILQRSAATPQGTAAAPAPRVPDAAAKAAREARVVRFPAWVPWAAAAGFAAAFAWQADVTGKRIAAMRAEHDAQRTEYAARVAELTREVQSARNATDLARLQVARLSSQLANQPRAQAVSLWNNATQQGVILVENLELPPPGKTYQLWVIDPANPNAPVDAGIFTTDAQGGGHIVFSPKARVDGAAAIAISLEQAGGVAVPTQVVMAGATTQL